MVSPLQKPNGDRRAPVRDTASGWSPGRYEDGRHGRALLPGGAAGSITFPTAQSVSVDGPGGSAFYDLRCEFRNYLTTGFLEALASDVAIGMRSKQKQIPSKYFYDDRGSMLFEEICRLPEYYPTRTELSILAESGGVLMDRFRGGDLVEIGSGANWKISRLIDAAGSPDGDGIRYVPVDVSESALIAAATDLLRMYPGLQVLGIIGDFTRDLYRIPNGREKIITFFGSTIGNFADPEACRVLKSVADVMRQGDRLLLGLDMVKPVPVLEAAYNDPAGITAEFNRNVLAVVNRELNANFDPQKFDHLAFFNEETEQIEMHLVAGEDMKVEIPALDMEVDFDRGETIHTEISRKFTRESADTLFAAAGLAVERWFTDRKGWFSLVELVRA
jgi:L-histidine Nalpha-methyltransferase